jgi:hypothetical protein
MQKRLIRIRADDEVGTYRKIRRMVPRPRQVVTDGTNQGSNVLTETFRMPQHTG